MIKRSYVLGVQDALVAAGVVKYANEEAAQADAAILGDALDQLPVDEAALATEDVAPEATAQLAAAVVNMAQEAGATADEAKAKAEIAAQAATELAKSGSLKFAEGDPVAGSDAGTVAAGENVAKNTDLNKELATAVPNTAEREDYFSPTPGQQADEGKGQIGTEEDVTPLQALSAKLTDLNSELATAVPNTSEREDVYGPAGAQADAGKGVVGTEEKQSSLLARLSRL